MDGSLTNLPAENLNFAPGFNLRHKKRANTIRAKEINFTPRKKIGREREIDERHECIQYNSERDGESEGRTRC